jgi:isoleucyl-tRNA synthetase
MPELEQYVLHLLTKLDHELKDAALNYEFNRYARALSDFCNNDLSAFFFDIRKDCLYCDAPSDPKRRAYRQVLDTLFHALVRYAAPILCFTAEEVWQTRYPSEDGSVHFLEWPEMERQWHGDSAFADRWEKLRSLRNKVTEAIEPYRRDKVIRSSLEAEVTVPASETPEGVDLAELFITAIAVPDAGATDVQVTKTEYHKCGRCWQHLPDVAEDLALCGRCDTVVNG